MTGSMVRWRIAVLYSTLVLGTAALVAGVAVVISDNALAAVLLSMAALLPVGVAAGWFIVDRQLTIIAEEVAAMLDRIESEEEERWAHVQDLSHELRNPLAIMATTLDVALADDELSMSELRRSARVSRRSVDRVARTVDDLIIFARNETPESRRTAFDLPAVLGEVVAEHLAPIDAQRLDVEHHGGPVVVTGDREAVKRAIGNILGNAVRLSRPGSVLRIGAGAHHGFAWVGVDDQGPGLDPAQHEDVFRRFWSADAGSLNGEPRSGLGLAIARQIAEQHGGLVTLRSELGAGAEFVIWIPLSPDADPGSITGDGVHPLWSPLLVTNTAVDEAVPETDSFISA